MGEIFPPIAQPLFSSVKTRRRDKGNHNSIMDSLFFRRALDQLSFRSLPLVQSGGPGVNGSSFLHIIKVLLFDKGIWVYNSLVFRGGFRLFWDTLFDKGGNGHFHGKIMAFSEAFEKSCQIYRRE